MHPESCPSDPYPAGIVERHPALIEPINCNGVRFEDFSTSYHLMWSLHATCCENVSIKNLTIRSTGGNGDGIDIDSCKHVHIDGCDISTGDDCISLKSGRGMGRGPSVQLGSGSCWNDIRSIAG